MKKNKIRILLSNDDGIHAEGLKILEEIASQLSDDIWIVAPESEQSGAAHSLSIGRPLRLRKLGHQRYTVNGTPTDCILVGVNKVMGECRPDLVLSGVNHGANIGEDVTYSGTVAVAMEATLLGIPAIALSQSMIEESDEAFTAARTHGPALIHRLLTQTWPKNVLININFPSLEKGQTPDIKLVSQGLRNLNDNLVQTKDPQGRSLFWIAGINRDNSPTLEATDLEAIQQGDISVTPLHLDLTHHEALETLKQAFVS